MATLLTVNLVHFVEWNCIHNLKSIKLKANFYDENAWPPLVDWPEWIRRPGTDYTVEKLGLSVSVDWSASSVLEDMKLISLCQLTGMVQASWKTWSWSLCVSWLEWYKRPGSHAADLSVSVDWSGTSVLEAIQLISLCQLTVVKL